MAHCNSTRLCLWLMPSLNVYSAGSTFIKPLIFYSAGSSFVRRLNAYSAGSPFVSGLNAYPRGLAVSADWAPRL